MAGEVFDTWPRNGVSYVVSDTSVSLAHVTISALLAGTVRRCPDDEMVVFHEQNVHWTWRTFAEQVDALATGLHALRFEHGDHIGIWSPNHVEWVLAQFATTRLGLVLININPAYRLSELECVFSKAGCKAIMAAEAFKTSHYLEILQTLALELTTTQPGALNVTRLPALCWVIRMGEADTPGMLNFADVTARGKSVPVDVLDAITVTPSPGDAIDIQFTGGTTGAPKGATLAHVNVVNNACFVAVAMNLQEGGRLCIPVPLYRYFGMIISVLAYTAAGACMVFPSEAFDPLATLRTVAKGRCTQLHGVPAMFVAQLDHPDFKSFDVSALRGGIMAGSPCPIEVIKRVVSELNLCEVTIAYGMTRTSPVSSQSAMTNPLDKRVTTVSHVQPHLQVRLVDGAGEVAPMGEEGELCTKGYSVVLGYWDDEARTAESIRDGWIRTDDLTTSDVGDYCSIVGRAKDMFVRGGENVYPREVGKSLFRYPKVQAVNVFGVSGPKYGEEACTWIVFKPGQRATEKEIHTFYQGQVAHYKIPCYVHFVTKMPMTVTGKVQEFVMCDRMVEELKLTVAATA